MGTDNRENTWEQKNYNRENTWEHYDVTGYVRNLKKS